MWDKLRALIPAAGSLAGLLGFGQVQGVIVGAIAIVVFLGGFDVGRRVGFRAGYWEGKKACERPDSDRRRLWPFREGEEELDLQPLEAAVPLE